MGQGKAGGATPDQAARQAELEELLRKAGADVNLQRLSLVEIGRTGQDPTTLYKGTNTLYHYTLMEVVAHFYKLPDPRIQDPRQRRRRPLDKAFPDFQRLKNKSAR